MNDTKQKAGDGVHWEHYCSVPECKKWGGLGYSYSPAAPVQWWCAEHYPHWNMHKK